LIAGTNSFVSCKRFPVSEALNSAMPVMLLPGLRLGTRPISMGSVTAEKTIGMVDVAALAANAEGGPPAAKMSVAERSTISVASAGSRS
jgi:hypothetical protein